MLFQGLMVRPLTASRSTDTVTTRTSLYTQFLFSKLCSCSSSDKCIHITTFIKSFQDATAAETKSLFIDIRKDLSSATLKKYLESPAATNNDVYRGENNIKTGSRGINLLEDAANKSFARSFLAISRIIIYKKECKSHSTSREVPIQSRQGQSTNKNEDKRNNGMDDVLNFFVRIILDSVLAAAQTLHDHDIKQTDFSITASASKFK